MENEKLVHGLMAELIVKYTDERGVVCWSSVAGALSAMLAFALNNPQGFQRIYNS